MCCKHSSHPPYFAVLPERGPKQLLASQVGLYTCVSLICLDECNQKSVNILKPTFAHEHARFGCRYPTLNFMFFTTARQWLPSSDSFSRKSCQQSCYSHTCLLVDSALSNCKSNLWEFHSVLPNEGCRRWLERTMISTWIFVWGLQHLL